MNITRAVPSRLLLSHLDGLSSDTSDTDEETGAEYPLPSYILGTNVCFMQLYSMALGNRTSHGFSSYMLFTDNVTAS